MKNSLKISGARVNNLQDVSIEIPLHKITCFAGPSGSGKTSLAFQTLYQESKRRFLNSFPTYLKFFSDRPAPVDVDAITPVLPVFGLPQINPVIGTRSTVSDIMQVTEMIQNLFYHFGDEFCPDHNLKLEDNSLESSIESSLADLKGTRKIHAFISKHNFLTHYKNSPFPSRSFHQEILDFDENHAYWEVLRFKSDKLDLAAKKLNEYIEKRIDIFFVDSEAGEIFKLNHSEEKVCPKCNMKGAENLSPAYFSPYNAIGACSVCNGFGANLEYDRDKLVDSELSVEEGGVKLLEYKRFVGHYDDLYWALEENGISTTKKIGKLQQKFWKILYEGSGQWVGFEYLFKYLESKRYKANVRIFIRARQKEVTCEECNGSRLNSKVKSFKITKDTDYLVNILGYDVKSLREYIRELKKKSSQKEFKKLIDKFLTLLDTAVGIGLGHLELKRKAKTVSAGEYQRLLLLKYLSYEGTGALFIFDEPSLGLSEKEKEMLYQGFQQLVSQKNTVLLVDHSKFFHMKSDYFVFMGPGAGRYGGKILYKGDYKKFKQKTLEDIPSLKVVKKSKVSEYISLESPMVYGKTFKDIKIPRGQITWVTGPSGSGKSATMINVLANRLYYDVYGEYLNLTRGEFKQLNYKNEFDDVIIVDANLNRYSSRSTFGTMTELFSIVRKHFLQTSVAKSMGLKDGHLSPNSQLGQCPKCEGKGFLTVEMQFLEDIKLECEDCKGLKLKPVYANLSDGNISIHEAYSSPVHEILDKIKLTPKFQRIYDYLKILKLDYLSLDREVMSLSGGERQRLYLLSKIQKNIENSILFFENLSFGLSHRELYSVASLIQELAEKGNTIVILDQDEFYSQIAHNTLKFN
jgi:excinuclease ABC subunit A